MSNLGGLRDSCWGEGEGWGRGGWRESRPWHTRGGDIYPWCEQLFVLAAHCCERPCCVRENLQIEILHAMLCSICQPVAPRRDLKALGTRTWNNSWIVLPYCYSVLFCYLMLSYTMKQAARRVQSATGSPKQAAANGSQQLRTDFELEHNQK